MLRRPGLFRCCVNPYQALTFTNLGRTISQAQPFLTGAHGHTGLA